MTLLRILKLKNVKRNLFRVDVSARKELESKIGKKVISNENYLPEKKIKKITKKK
jgi:hypothetical protein